MEKFGLVGVSLALVLESGNLYLIPRRWTFLGMPLPNALLPSGDSFETEKNGDFRFDVTIKAPIFGLIAAYKGWLRPIEKMS